MDAGYYKILYGGLVVDVLQVLECKVYSCDSQLEASVGVEHTCQP